jgi:hypothetical protein
MKKSSLLTAATLGAVAAVTLPFAVASAQEDKMYRPPAQPEATFYRDLNYSGPAVYVNEAKPSLQLNWPVNSIRIKSGRWQLCERANFGGECRTYDRDTAMLYRPYAGRRVQSIRPIGWSPPGEPGGNPSLRGMAAQFYPAPAVNGYRALACRYGSASAACAKQAADRFCVSMNWRASARQSMETVAGRIYLADVLCSHTGH